MSYIVRHVFDRRSNVSNVKYVKSKIIFTFNSIYTSSGSQRVKLHCFTKLLLFLIHCLCFWNPGLVFCYNYVLGTYWAHVWHMLAYLGMISLAVLVRRYVALNMRGSNNQQQRKADAQRRLTRVLIIQVSK